MRKKPTPFIQTNCFCFHFSTGVNNWVRCSGTAHFSLFPLNFSEYFIDGCYWTCVKIKVKGWIEPSSSAIYLILMCGSYWDIFKNLHAKEEKALRNLFCSICKRCRYIASLSLFQARAKHCMSWRERLSPSAVLCSTVFCLFSVFFFLLACFQPTPVRGGRDPFPGKSGNSPPLPTFHSCSLQFLPLLFFLFSLLGTEEVSQGAELLPSKDRHVLQLISLIILNRFMLQAMWLKKKESWNVFCSIKNPYFSRFCGSRSPGRALVMCLAYSTVSEI